MLNGVLDGANLPSDWSGATATINIRDSSGALVRDHVAVTLNTTTHVFDYQGAPLTVPGLYTWEIEITFPSVSAGPITWPNGRNMTLLMLAQVG